MLALRERNKELTDQIATRLRDNPNNGDIERGDALNAILDQLSNPRVHPSALRMARVPLSNKSIRKIPFRYESEVITFSMQQLTAKAGWPPSLRGDAFKAERQAYQKAIDAALEQDKEGDLAPRRSRRCRTPSPR